MVTNKNNKDNEFSRFNVLTAIMFVIFFVVIWRLINIQVVNGELYKETANQQNHKIISTVAPRGDIIDRNGKKLAESKQSYILTFTNTEESEVIKDANGNELNDGDTVTIIKDLKVKGATSALKQGTKVKNIRLLYGVSDGHDIDCKIDGFGAMKLKSSVVKKI
jgi:protein PhnA